jgi:hypothetical protein
MTYISYLPAAHSGQSPVYGLQGKLGPTIKQALKYIKIWLLKKNISNSCNFQK